MTRDSLFRFRSVRTATLALAAFTLSCTPLQVRPPAPATPFKPIPFEAGAKFKSAPLPESSRVRSRYASPGGEGVILDLPVTPPVPPPTGTSTSGLAPGCDPVHYLLDRANPDDKTGVDNRFSWWDKTPPPSGPLRPPATISEQLAARDSLICHFHPALARIVGTPTSRISSSGFKLSSWADQSITSPNQLSDVEFVVRRLRPHTLPTVRDLARAGSGTERVLVNQSDVAPDISGDRFRPSLWLEFAVPQRAVAIEFGAPTDANQAIKTAGVKLIGYDLNGSVLRIETSDGSADLRADGRTYGGDTTLVLGDYGNVIGIQDSQGRIARVELRFDFTNADALDEGGDPGNKITAPQVVQRIWHEPLPPAAVFQGFVGVSTHETATTDPNVIPAQTFEQRFGKPAGPQTLTVPFGFDRAVVMIRGVRWQFAFFQPLPVTELSATLGPTGVVQLGPGNRELTITPTGRINGDGQSSDRFHLVIDYTVLAWRRDQVELFASTGSAASGGAQDDQAVARLTMSDPCPFSSTSLSVERRRELCGPLFGAPQGFAMRMTPAQEIDRMDLVIASETGLASGQGLSLRRDDQNGQPIVVWEQGMHFEGSDDNPHTLEFVGTVLSGTSLKVGPDSLGSPPPEAVRHAANPPAFPRADTGPRDDRTAYGFPPSVYRAFGIAWPVVGDVAFVALEQFYTEPSDPLHELDVEVKGDTYQGAIVDWKTGLGINTEPPIIGGIGATRDRFVSATALFGAVDNVAPFSLASATKRDIVFETGIVGLTQRAAEIPGLIENTSREALWIDDLRRGTQPADSLFQLEFLFPRHPIERGSGPQLNFVRVTEDQLRDRLPMLLRPGERITILGRYTPKVATTFLPDMGSAEFRLRGISNNLRVFVLGSAIEANPRGEWRPTELVFAATPPAGAPQQQVALLAGTGSTPLAINRLFFEDASLGYGFVMLPQIEPDFIGVRVTCGDANAACRNQTRLVADTNAGMIALTVRVQP